MWEQTAPEIFEILKYTPFNEEISSLPLVNARQSLGKLGIEYIKIHINTVVHTHELYAVGFLLYTRQCSSAVYMIICIDCLFMKLQTYPKYTYLPIQPHNFANSCYWFMNKVLN